MVPKRWARRAVTRNTIKRQIYAVGALFEARLPQAAHVVRLRTAFDRKAIRQRQLGPAQSRLCALNFCNCLVRQPSVRRLLAAVHSGTPRQRLRHDASPADRCGQRLSADTQPLAGICLPV